MLDNNSNNELDKLFQTKLQNNEAAENNWNVPPSDVFENALLEMEEPKKKRRWPLLLLFGSSFLMLCAVGYMFYRNQSMILELDKKIEVLNQTQLKNQVEDKIVELSSVETATKSIKEQITEEVKSNSENRNKSNKINKSAVSSDRQHTIEKNVNLYFPYKNESIVSTNRVSIPAHPTTSNLGSNMPKVEAVGVGLSSVRNFSSQKLTSNTTVNEQMTGSNAVDDAASSIEASLIPTLNFQLTREFIYNLPLALIDPVEKAKYKEPKESGKLSAYVLAGLHTSKFNTNFPNDAIVTNEVNLGSQIGFGLVHQFSERWAMDCSISYKNFTAKSNYNCELTYDKNEEVVNSNGDLVYNMEMTAFNPLYAIYQSVEMPVEEDQMGHGDIFHNNVVSDMKLNVITINTGARYRAANFGKFNLFLNTGLGANALLETDDEMKMEVLKEDHVMMAKESKMAGNQQFFMSGYIGLQLDYKLNDRMSIGLNNNYERIFQSLHVNPDVNYSSKLNAMNTTLRVGFDF